MSSIDGGQRLRRQPQVTEAASFEPGTIAPPQDVTGLRSIFWLIRENLLLILLLILLSIGAGVFYLAQAPSQYIASSTLLVDPATSSMPEEYYIESQTQTMRSDVLLRKVVEELNLVEAGIEQDDRSFFLDHARAAKRFLGRYIPALASDPEEGDPVQGAVSILRRNLAITRAAMTPVITISYQATDPERAAAIVNTLIESYRSQRRTDETAGAQQSVAWLTERLAGVRQQLDDADQAIETFRTENKIVGSGANQSLLAEQRLYELSIQLEALRAAAEGSAARSEIRRDARGNGPTVPQSAAPADREVAMLSDTLAMGERQGRLELDTPVPASPLTGLSDPEPGRSQEQQGPDALAKRSALEEAVEEAARQAGQMNRAIAHLGELEASAEIYRSLYTSMLQRYEEAVQQSLLPVSDGAQVLIGARTPDRRSHPRSLLVLVFAGLFGVTLGMGAAALRVHLFRPEAPAGHGLHPRR
jgi:polysaccharide biosynthesis transport protein